MAGEEPLAIGKRGGGDAHQLGPVAAGAIELDRPPIGLGRDHRGPVAEIAADRVFLRGGEQDHQRAGMRLGKPRVDDPHERRIAAGMPGRDKIVAQIGYQRLLLGR